MSAQPSRTLYVNNLNDKVKKPELRQQLYQLFTPYGRVVDIVALKTAKMRGQAHVVFVDQVAATTALRALGGETFYGKPLKITYSKTVSKALIPASQSTAPTSNKVVLSTAQREADELKRSREEDDTIRERADKRARGEEDEGDEDEGAKGGAAGEDDEDAMDMDESDDDAPGPKP